MDLSADSLAQCFFNTFSADREPRKAAEDRLNEAANVPNFALAVLNLAATPTFEEALRHAAAVNFKNHLRQRWAPDQDSEFNPITDDEKNQIKTLIVSFMLSSSSPRVQSQLSEALSLIGKHDFPRAWPSLLPELVNSLAQAASQSPANCNYATINGILGTANSIFKKFRYGYADKDLCIDLKYCLDNFAAPLLEIFLRTAALIDSAAGAGGVSVETLKPLFESQRLCCRIFYSLNFQGLPEFFEDHMSEWMAEFTKYLTADYPAVADDLRAAVCENIILYVEKNEEEFQPYLGGFAQAVAKLLLAVSQNLNHERLAVTAIKFLTTVSTSVHHSLFRDNNVVLEICEKIVIPNARLSEDDEELFDMNYVEYIRRDMEGSDLDTRRRIACELLKGIATNYKQQVTAIVSAQIENLLSSYAADPAKNWKDKHCAMHLVVSLASKKSGGADVLTDDIVNVEHFLATVIVPELQSQDVNAYPMLKAGALKFFTMARNQLPKPLAIQFLPDLARFLGAESSVVHSYAACCIEKLLLVKDDGAQARYTAADLGPFIRLLMNNLFNALTFQESEENQYIMKCIMRVIGVADINGDIADPCSNGLTSILNRVCKNPKNPIFNHYLFESVAVLVRRACDRDISLLPTLEARLFPSLETILVENVAEFLPYAFQLLAQLVELNQPPISPSYMQVFKLLLSPEFWNTKSNVPALVRLLQAFLLKAPHELKEEGMLSQVLGIFQRLVSSPSTEERGFHLLNTVIENLDFAIIAPYMTHIWAALFTRLQKKETVKFIKSLVIFMSLFLIKHGPENLINTMNSVQADIFPVILNKYWIPKLKLITGHIEVKLVAVASCRLICESPLLLDPTAACHWGKMLDGIVTLLSKPEEDRVEEEPEMPDIAENAGYAATFVKLYNAGRKEDDPLKSINDPKHFLAASLSRLSAASPGRFPQVINQNLDSANQTAVMQLCITYNCPVV